ncbi:HD domain-containing protein [Terracoccus luteus]|uniref:HD domain-containing protein n=2 Tax=Terracoccus luteus TaxID=53356 RepID=A0A495XX83_9MICO|nr:HD domain-containing protein [Terracoccus luteus]
MKGEAARQPASVTRYISVVACAAVLVGVCSFAFGTSVDVAPLLLFCAMGVLSVRLREPNVTSRIAFSFLSIILLASAVVVGPFGAWLVGLVSMATDRNSAMRWQAVTFNTAQASIVGGVGAWAYLLVGGAADVGGLMGLNALGLNVGIPLIIADIVQCLINASLLSGVIHVSTGAPVRVLVRQILVSSGTAYIGYGVIGFLFVILWFPAKLGAYSAVLILAPLLVARWAFVQYGEELRSHERTLETLVTTLGRKDADAVARSRATAQLAEWVAEELALTPAQIGTVRYAGALREIGLIGVPWRVLHRPPELLSDPERRVLSGHAQVGARLIEGIDFLEDARSGIQHQDERFDGTGRPDGLAGTDIPPAARIIAVAGEFVDLTQPRHGVPPLVPEIALARIADDAGRFDPRAVRAIADVLERHGWAVPVAGSQP